MKPKFGDLEAKTKAQAALNEALHFERRVATAGYSLQWMPELPPPGSPKSAFPRTVYSYSLDVLEEACRRERERRGKENGRD